jgi:ABC-type nitrate/sulfonate/bicarbonate transport system ATPase subunit
MMMFQESALFPWLDVMDNVMFGLKLKPNLDEQRAARGREVLSPPGRIEQIRQRQHSTNSPAA